MKTLYYFLFFCLLTSTAAAQNGEFAIADFKFDEETIDYGEILKGSDKIRVFKFTNVGNAPLIIEKIQSSCGCTVPEKPEEPILPGKKGEIKVSYDTNKLGGFSKMITIFSNAKMPRKIIKIKGFVK